MSWGERSCKGCPNDEASNQCDMGTCNVDCKWYKHDGETRPDSSKTDQRNSRLFNEETLNLNFKGLKFCERCKAMKSKSHIKKCKKKKCKH